MIKIFTLVLILVSCGLVNRLDMITEKEILAELDNQSEEFPGFEMQYAATQVRLFADTNNWAIVFDNIYYNLSGGCFEREFIYYGNCIRDIEKNNKFYPNAAMYPLVAGREMKSFLNPIVGKDVKIGTHSININGQNIDFVVDPVLYKKLDLLKNPETGEDDQELSAVHILRYLCEAKKGVFTYSDSLVYNHIPASLPEIMTIDEWCNEIGVVKKPSLSEANQLMAKVLATKDPSYWKPTLRPNSNWRMLKPSW